MQLLDAWTSLAPFDLVRLLLLPVVVLLAALLPGRRAAMAAALLVAVTVAGLDELAAPSWVRIGWVVLWALVAWQAGARGEGAAPARPARRGALEAGAVSLPLGFALLVLLLVALSRQDLAPAEARRASLGALVVAAGLLHLMLRRHVRRALVAFAALALGLELLAASARATDVLHAGPPAGAALGAALLAVALVTRIAVARERFAGSPLVSDAHDLRD
ncbi:MAG TPA: hypothetical protein VMH61_04250 [Candidatus Acidoferrales bacterium]|nr:hypothetical protein [Candidatus Acidoferrales bacterium]